MSGYITKRVQINKKNGRDNGGFKKSGSGGGVGMPPILRRFAASIAPAVKKSEDVVVEPEIRYRYFKIFITKIRGTNDICQMSEFALYEQNGTNINLNGLSISNPGGNPGDENETVIHLTDGNLHTKWTDRQFYYSDEKTTTIKIDFGSDYISKPVPKLYIWATANDFPGRDPVSWTISGSTDDTNWVVLDSQTDYLPTTERRSFVPSTGYFSLTY